MKLFLRLSFMIGLHSTLLASTAYANDPIRPGVEIKNKASLGVVIGDDSSSLFYNPANLDAPQGFSTNAESTLLSIHHSYKHPDYDVYNLDLVVPLITVGTAWRPNKKLIVGFSLFPTGAGTEATFSGLPVDITPTTTGEADVTGKQTGYNAALGGNYAIRSDFSVGLSVVQMYKKNDINIYVNGTDEDLVDGHMEGLFHQFRLGAQGKVAAVKMGFFYSPEVVMEYSGEAATPALGSEDYEEIGMTEYIPSQMGLGAEFEASKYKVFGEYSREQHAKGRFVAVSAMTSADSFETNLSDTNNLAAGGEYLLSGKHWLGAGLGYYEGNIGDPTWMGEGGEFNQGISGMRFGDFDGMTRYEMGLNYKRAARTEKKASKNISKLTYKGGLHGAIGESSVSDGLAGQGEYKLRTVGLSGSMTYGF
jgi:hypothetical protein